MSSVFVDPAGEWKLGGVDYMYPAQGPDSVPPVKVLPLLERYNSPEKTEGKNIKAEKWFVLFSDRGSTIALWCFLQSILFYFPLK